MSLSREDKNEIIISLHGVCEDMLMNDRDKCYSACKYIFTPNPLNYQDKPKKTLMQTKNYIRVYYKDEYLGIAPKADSRFDEKGQFIEDRI
jgi:hypothetical protein